MHRSIVPFNGDAFELDWGRRELHPGSNWYRRFMRTRRMRREVNFYRAKPYRLGRTGNLLGAHGHLLINAMCVAPIRAHH
ncbi:MAG: hypothetical protein Q7J04_04265 [Microcella sp.]|nr:hypothetical protein [Microcella sp.]